MKKIILFSLVILVTSIISIILFSFLTGKSTYPESIIQTKINSQILNEEREIIIHLPINYDESKKYPVMYVLDGSSQDKHLANKFNILSAAGYVPETIIVGLPNVNGEGRQRDYTPPYMRMDIDEEDSPMGEGDKFISFMEKELFPFMQKNYSISEVRSLAGNSRGGLLVIYSLIYKPQLFTGRFCFSPALWRDDKVIVKEVANYLKNTKNRDPSFLFMSLGDEENSKMKSAFNETIKAIKENSDNSLVWHSYLTKDANHQNNAEKSASIGIRKWTDFTIDFTPELNQ